MRERDKKKITDEQLRNRISDHISCCVLEGACVTANNGRATNCSCVADVRIDETLYSNLEKCLLDYNSFDNKNRTLYIQGLVLQGYILSQRRNARDKWTPEYHPKGVIDENDSQYFFCRNGIQKLFALGYRKWKSLTEQVRLPKLKVSWITVRVKIRTAWLSEWQHTCLNYDISKESI